MKSLLNFLFPKKSHLIYLLVLFIVGTFLRLIRIPAQWDGDFAQFYLVANHIVKYKEFPAVGQYASAINFYYSPYSYYILAFLMLFNSSVQFIISVFALTHSLSVFTVYLIGKSLFDNSKTGLLAAFFFAIASTEIFYSRSLMGNTIVIPFTLMSFLFFILYMKKSKILHLLMSYGFIFFGGLFNYAHFPVVVIYAIYSCFKTGKILKVICLNMLFVLFYAAFNFPLLMIFDTKTIYFPYFSGINIYKSLYDIYLFLESVFAVDPSNIIKGLLLIWFLTGVNIFYKKYNFKPLFILFSSILIIYFLLSFICRTCYPSYYTSVYPFFYFCLSFLIVNLISLKKFFAWAVIYGALIFSVYIFTNDMHRMYFYDDTYENMDLIADKIIADAKFYGYHNFNAVVINGQNFWHSPTVWYFLEKKMNQKFAKTATVPLGLEMAGKPDGIYVICKDESIKCLDFFKKKYNGYRLKFKLPVKQPYYVFFASL